jgi:hypothetical protein
MALQVNDIIAKCGLNTCVLVYVKDERNIFFTMTSTLTSIVSCEVLGLSTPFIRAY